MAAAVVDMMADQTLDSRVARLEADVNNIRSDISAIKLDIRDLRKEARDIDSKLAKLDSKLIGGLASNRIWMLLQSAALLGVMARGFEWL
ncbi:MAG TPA: hypothetical protein VIY50_02105 [Steroidobacteraceae bacterium]